MDFAINCKNKILDYFNRKNNNNEAISAGGIIVCRRNSGIEILLIRDKRYKAWVLPKGHVEKGETLEQAALREINEEAGVTKAKIMQQLGSFRRYVPRAQEWKTIHYFLMSTEPHQPLGRVNDKRIETKWFPVKKLPEMYLPEQLKVVNDNLEAISRFEISS